MGLEKSESSEVYTKFFALDVAASQQVRLSLDTQDACCQGQRLIVKAQQKGNLAMVLSSLNRARVSGQHCL